ncbi:hypothetical protein [Aquabacterium sp. A7-Y]|uniref:hypothetical protein n=1 Tax=Aquabacterium sp. A7-Y TaxID=1349605 RepID=UPI0039FC7E77
MKLAHATVLITGANRGIGPGFAPETLARVARRLYASVRDPGLGDTARVQAAKSRSGDIVARALDALEAGADEVLAGDFTRQVKQGLRTERFTYLLAE